jgi:phosphate starvation-inducible PhoH-like protein
MFQIKEFILTNEDAQIISGSRDANIEYMEQLLNVQIFARGNVLKIKGDDASVNRAVGLLARIKDYVKIKRSLQKSEILKLAEENASLPKTNSLNQDTILVDSKKKNIHPKSSNQKKYLDAIRNYDLVMGIGPAGTGKTYLAVACGIEMVKQGRFQKIVLTRPALEAGEKLGFLPGDLEEKIKPYLQPIYDSLYDIMRYDEIKKWTDRKILEVIPLAYMRGRTLSSAFIILDEAQNTTFEQMKMFLTRLGPDSKAVVTGDITQIDIPLSSYTSGLVEIQNILHRVSGIKFVYFSNKDVVRHSLVKKIINAYERHARKKESGISGRKPSEENKGQR